MISNSVLDINGFTNVNNLVVLITENVNSTASW